MNAHAPMPDRHATGNGAATAAASLLALAGWATLALQLYLIVQVNLANGSGWPTAVVRYFSFFTILSNLFVAAVLSAPWLPAAVRAWLSRATVRGAAAAYIGMVGIVYSLVLRALWQPQGLQKLADTLLHDVMPLGYVAVWIVCFRTGTLRRADVWRWLAFPLLYLAYSLARGALTAWYPYPFLDAAELGYRQVLINAGGITGGFLILALAVVAVDGRGFRR